jgi:hypothetical protein
LKIFTGAKNLPVFLLPPHILKRRLVLGLLAVVVARVVGGVCASLSLLGCAGVEIFLMRGLMSAAQLHELEIAIAKKRLPLPQLLNSFYHGTSSNGNHPEKRV